jgi:hypothetical protein
MLIRTQNHDADWWEYYGTDQFPLYQEEQTRFLANLASQKPYEKWRISHQFNTAGNTVPVYNPFVGGDAQSEFVPDLK